MKALVTGGGGFLGRAITEMLLGRGNSVRILARQDYPVVRALGAEGMQGDIRNLDDCLRACMGMDAVFHTAALPGIWGDINAYGSINVLGTQNIIAACKRRGVGKLIFTSSPSVNTSGPAHSKTLPAVAGLSRQTTIALATSCTHTG